MPRSFTSLDPWPLVRSKMDPGAPPRAPVSAALFLNDPNYSPLAPVSPCFLCSLSRAPVDEATYRCNARLPNIGSPSPAHLPAATPSLNSMCRSCRSAFYPYVWLQQGAANTSPLLSRELQMHQCLDHRGILSGRHSVERETLQPFLLVDICTLSPFCSCSTTAKLKKSSKVEISRTGT